MKLCLYFILFFTGLNAFSQTDTIEKNQIDSVLTKPKIKYLYRDSATIAKAAFIRDSLTWLYLKPDSNRKNLFVEALLEKYITNDPYLLSLSPKIEVKKSLYGSGLPVSKNPGWVIGMIFFLLISFGVLRIVFKKQLSLMFQAFYDNRVLAQINKEDNVFVSWHFLFSYLIFSFTIGLFLYVIFVKIPLNFTLSGVSLYVLISICFALFLGFKIIALRFLGYLFMLQRMVNEYINIIYLSFFNISIVFLPLTFILVLISHKETNIILTIGFIILSFIFILQFLRAAFQILGNYKLSKFYLILYLCTLEICPILIIVKALNIF